MEVQLAKIEGVSRTGAVTTPFHLMLSGEQQPRTSDVFELGKNSPLPFSSIVRATFPPLPSSHCPPLPLSLASQSQGQREAPQLLLLCFSWAL